MNEELILKKRSDGIRLLIDSKLEELASLSEIIASEVIKMKPASENECHWFIYRLLEAMEKTVNAMEIAAAADYSQQESTDVADENSSSVSYSVRPQILDYYMTESMDNYFRSGLKKPLAKVPGCAGCLDLTLNNNDSPLLKVCTHVGGQRSNTVGDLSSTFEPISTDSWEQRQSWHALQYPESLQNFKAADSENEKSSQVDVDELTEIPIVNDIEPTASSSEMSEVMPDLHEEINLSAPPSSPRFEENAE